MIKKCLWEFEMAAGLLVTHSISSLELSLSYSGVTAGFFLKGKNPVVLPPSFLSTYGISLLRLSASTPSIFFHPLLI